MKGREHPRGKVAGGRAMGLLKVFRKSEPQKDVLPFMVVGFMVMNQSHGIEFTEKTTKKNTTKVVLGMSLLKEKYQISHPFWYKVSTKASHLDWSFMRSCCGNVRQVSDWFDYPTHVKITEKGRAFHIPITNWRYLIPTTCDMNFHQLEASKKQKLGFAQDVWKKNSQMVVFHGDESHGRIRKKKHIFNKQIQENNLRMFETIWWLMVVLQSLVGCCVRIFRWQISTQLGLRTVTTSPKLL